MKIFFDTEFSGLHKNTTLISIGMMSENWLSFYAEFTDYDKSQCDEWINENVIANLKYNDVESFCDKDIVYTKEGNYFSKKIKANTSDIKKTLALWLNQFDSIELVSDVCHYDMVLFIDIFGGAFDVPKAICPCCYDINQDIAKHYQCSMAEAFDKSREEILTELSFTDSVYEAIIMNGIFNVDEFCDVEKHNSLFDALVIQIIYNLLKERDV